jgi:hypothetical protein
MDPMAVAFDSRTNVSYPLIGLANLSKRSRDDDKADCLDGSAEQLRHAVQCRNSSHAILLSLADFESILLAAESERIKQGATIRELSPIYALGAQLEDR